MADKKINNPLDELFTDSLSQIEPTKLATLLKPFIRISRENNRILFTSDGMKITSNKKIILFALARKALHIQGIIESETVSPKEVKEELGKNIPAGTIDAALKRLSDNGPLKNQEGKYFIPDFNFSQVLEIFSKFIQT